MQRLSDIEVDARALALARIGIGLGALLNIVEAYFTLIQVAEDGTVAMPTFDGLPAVTTVTVTVFLALTAPAAIALMLGLFVPVVAPWLAVTTLAVIAWEQQTYSNHYVLAAWLCAWLTFARSDRTWALGAADRAPAAPTLDRVVLLMTQLSICYCFAALVKLNGPFLSGDTLRGYMSVGLPDAAYPLLAVATVATEFTLAVGLWIPRFRWVAAAAGLGLHLVIPFTITKPYPLVSFSIICLSLYPLFLTRPSTIRSPQWSAEPRL